MNPKLLFKRILAMMLVVLLLVSATPLATFAEGNNVGDVVDGDIVNGGEITGDTNGEADVEEPDDVEEIIGVPVANLDELMQELANGAEAIAVTADILIDRPVYVTTSVIIYSEESNRLIRDVNYAGDLFVVGQNEDGMLCEEEVTLTFGREDDAEGGTLTIDGNKENITASVVGSALFVCAPGHVIVYGSTAIVNHKKVGNERTYHENVTVSYPVKVGGAAAIIANGGVMDIYGGTISGNEVNVVADDVDTCVQGGAIYNYGTLNIYDGTIDGNKALFGGALFNYRKMNIHRAVISNNYAEDLGGAIYTPNSTGAFTYIGEDAAGVEAHVSFNGNSAKDSGGAIYARNAIDISNAYFKDNSTVLGEGGAIVAYTIEMTMDNVIFDGNRSGTNGAAVYLSGSNENEEIPELDAQKVTFRNNSGKYGALFAGSLVRVSLEDATFENNSGTYGSAIYTTGGMVDVNGATFSGNTSTTRGGVIYCLENATVTLNNITATGNKSKAGGFLYSLNTVLKVYDSTFEGNTSTDSGAVMCLFAGAATEIYNCTFRNNTAAVNAGVLQVYTDEAPVLIHSSTFTDNTSSGYGGVIHASSKSKMELYCITATNNVGGHGGFMYITTTGTTATIGGLTLAGNIAITGGNNIWSNSTGAKMYLDQSKCVENDYAGVRGDAYWSAFVSNKPKVYYQTVEVPAYSNYYGEEIIPVVPIVPLDVTTATELEKALASDNGTIRVMADIVLDRTLYITKDTTIFAASTHTITRGADFAGDLFVVGQKANGVLCEEGVTLTLGRTDDPEASLIIDGNKANTTVDVVGSAVFVCDGAIANLNKSVTLQNHKKVGNERTSHENVTVSYPVRVGGSVAIIASGGQMNIYGATVKNNEVNTTADSNQTGVQGGAIYNYGTTNVYGGLFEGNSAHFGGVFFNYRRLNIYNAIIQNNVSADLGGAIYVPNSTSAFTNIGTENDVVESQVLFSGNQAGDDGGAIYARNSLNVANTRFENNTTKGYGGAIIAQTVRMTLKDMTFSGNTASSYGGALYVSGSNGKEDTLELNAENVVFENNTSNSYAGALYLSNARAFFKNATFTGNQGTYGGAIFLKAGNLEVDKATFSGNFATTKGGVIYSQGDTAEDETLLTSTVVMNKVTAIGNSSVDSGFAYFTNTDTEIYASHFAENTCTASSAVMYLAAGADTTIYGSVFENNESAKNGGVITAYTSEAPVLIQDCQFLNNTCHGYGGVLHVSGKTDLTLYDNIAVGNCATHGGFMYETTAGTVVKLVKLTVDDNTASTGGPIIWGNTANAKLYIDKSQMNDLDNTGAYDDAYWKTAIVNKLTVYDIREEVPKYLDYKNEPYPNMQDAVDVHNAEELETAINANVEHIRVTADFELDRTFYVTTDTVIFSTFPYTLTRAADFGGDIFVVGEEADGTASFIKKGVATLTLGNPDSVQENLLTIDGNKANMSVDVVGSVLFVVHAANVDLHQNVTIINAYKNGNERVYSENYMMKPDIRVGGSVAVVVNGALNIYGGNYRYNEVNPVTQAEDGSNVYNSIYGGVIFNYNTTRIFGGTFADNIGSHGGVIFNYQTLEITGGVFENNHATSRGGVIYAYDSASAHTRIGTIPEAGTSQVTFRNNSSVSHGGAIYSSQLAALVIYEGATFDGNHAVSSGGAICVYGQMTVYNGLFINNVADNRGGAVYLSYNNNARKVRYVKFVDCVFENNQGYYGGALSSYASSSDYETGGIAEVDSCTFTNNRAVKQTSGTTKASGGAIYADRRSKIMVIDSAFSGNTAQLEGGTLYASSESTMTVENCTIDGSASEKHGGAITVRSSYFDMTDTTISNSQATNNGGAIYVSYNSNREMNAKVNLVGCTIKNNSSTEGYGGAIYATKRALENEHPVLTIKDTDFDGNSAKESGGSLFIAAGLDAYLKNVNFTNSISLEGKGGALYTTSGIIEYDTGVLTNNKAELSNGGAIALDGSAVVTLNNLTATDNHSGGSGGFMIAKADMVKLYNSTIKDNVANSSAGGIYGQATLSVYKTTFEGNRATANGGAVVAYTDGKQMTLQDCSLINNTAGSFGGAVYASGSSLLDLYDVTATENTADKGGFLYETTTGTVVTLGGIALSGNTATEAPIIWGNSAGAVLKIDKSKYTDQDYSGAYNNDYWAQAVANTLTVEDVSVSVPSYSDYVARKEETEKKPSSRKVVPVDEIFALAESSSDGSINSTYDAFPRLDNRSNFMSNGTKVFEDINGQDVTVDTIVYAPGKPDSNMNFSQGMLIYQAMLYKQAHPEEDVDIRITSYRFSVQAGLCINRNSRYFGYMRQMPHNVNCDKFGFVRIAYLLISAAKMGINVTVIAHQDAYPTSSTLLKPYFEGYQLEPCDPSYVGDGKQVKDYLNFAPVDWTLGHKGGTDMMHLKLCAVSDYLDMNGVEHHNAVWTSSSNLDGIKENGSNANLGQQSAIIISDHEDIYRISKNYVDLMAQYTGQEEIYEFQHILNYRSTKQVDQFLSGKGGEVVADKQVVYVGSEKDDVFELYFTPMGGNILSWDEDTNAYCKYIREMYESEDYIEFIWNAAEYTGMFGLGQQIEAMINTAFHENKNVNNKVYMNTKTFTGESFDDLVVGQDIGLKSFNKREMGAIHNKDVSISYVKDGQRYYVSLMNSMNMHSGSMYFQANHMLVIKETDCNEDSVYFTVMDRSTKGIVEHAYGDLQMYLPETPEHGYCYYECTICGKQDVIGEAHNPGEWIVDREYSEGVAGLQHRNCMVCGALAESAVVTEDEIKILNHSEITGRSFKAYEDNLIPVATTSTPHTFEVSLKLPTTFTSRAGVILGNYTGGSEDQVNLEVYNDGKLRLFILNRGVRVTHVFETDIRSDEGIRLALTVEGTTACVYINGILVETATLSTTLPEGLTNFVAGGDLRSGNAQHFRGNIYEVALFADIRSAEEVALDTLALDEKDESLMYVAHYTRDGETTPHTYSYFCDVDCDVCGFVHKADAHTYDDICDADCNVCGTVRVSGLHVYDSDCDPECNACGAVREVTDHVYSGVCDPDCNSCGLEREAAEHTYDNACDAVCNVCGEGRTPAEHVYDDLCDPSCNECGAQRSDIHVYSGECDPDCNLCGAVREASKHSYTDADDTECDGCGFVRVFAAIVTQPTSVCAGNGEQVTITLDVVGDGLTYKWYFANKGSSSFLHTATFTDHTYFIEMNSTRSGRRIYCVVTDAYGNSVQTNTVSLNMLPHTYSAVCDATCDLCNEVREIDVEHTYADACDETCDLCGYQREAVHAFDHEYDVECNLCLAVREVDIPVAYSGSSISEDVSGLAFRFSLAVDGMKVKNTTCAVYDSATVGDYKLLSMGALVTNGADQRDVPAVYLWSLQEDMATYAVRIINIPTTAYDVEVTATPYFVIEKDGQVFTVYGEAQTKTYNGVHSSNVLEE